MMPAPTPLEIADERDDGEDEHDEEVVLADEAEVGVEDPFGQEREPGVEENAAEDELGM